MSCSTQARLMLTWWNHDILLWQLPKRVVDGNLDLIDPDTNSHRLLTQFRLTGDENISCAQISGDGSMVVAATAAGTRLFQIRKRTEVGEVEIRARPIDLPASLSSFGASVVGFSPDSKWLYAVRPNNLLVMVKISSGKFIKDRPQIHSQVVKLACPPRPDSGSQPSKLANYLQSIHCVAFSDDSRILAVGSLSGAVEWWVLKGHEDLQDQLVDTEDALSNSDSESDSDSDTDDESDSRIIHGQKWVRGTSYATLPNLSSAVLALNFRPQPHLAVGTSDAPLGMHATRHTPHPVSHELPSTDTKLVAVTASHEIMEFDVFSGKLSDWSRRNPSACLPRSFSQIKDRTMGLFWDHDSSQKERLWLYGPTWLFMVDMARDLNIVDAQDKIGQIGRYDVREPLNTASAKRASDDLSPVRLKKRRKQNAGAGDEKRFNRTTNARPMSTYSGTDIGLMSPVSDYEGNPGDSDEDVEMEDGGILINLRRGQESVGDSHDDEELNDASQQAQSIRSVSSISTPSYHTIFRYRSIFGIAALDPDPKSKGEQDHPTNLEIILVERPMYDIDLLPRFDSGQDWTT